MPLTANKPKKPLIHYLDLFSGNSARLKRMAKTHKWKNKRLRGIELQKPSNLKKPKNLKEGRRTLVLGKNLKIHFNEVLKELKKYKTQSVQEVNSDYLFGGIKSDYSKKGGLDYSYDSEANLSDKIHKVSSILNQVKRILVKGGQLSLSDYAINKKFLVEIAESHGFKLERNHPITKKKQAKSRDLRKSFNEMKLNNLARKNVENNPIFKGKTEIFTKFLDNEKIRRHPVRLIFRKVA